MDDEQPDHPHDFLHRAVGVVEVAAFLVQVELVDEGLAGGDRLLGDALDAVVADGHLQAVEVDGGRLGQPVVDDEPDPVALDGLDQSGRACVPLKPQT